MIFRSFRRHNAKGDKGLATSRRRPVFFRPWVEQLETRILLSAVSWMSNQSGFWDVGSNWSTGQVPSATDDVTINVPGITVTVRDGRLAHSLQCQDALVLSAGGLTLGADSEMDGPLTLGNATLTTNGVLTLTGNDTWSAGTVTGSGSVANQGTLNLTGSGESLQVILNNTGTITQTGSGSLNVSAALNLLSAGIYDLQADSGLTGGGTLTNAGLLKKSAGSGTSTIGLALNNTGVVEADSGTLSMSGTISKATSSALTGGSWTANNATLDLASAPNLTANQGTVTLSGPNSVFSKINGLTSNGGRLSILAGQNFIAAGDFTNSGIVTVGTGALQMSGHAFTNQAGGLLDLQNDNAFNGASQVSNAGTFRKSGGAGTLLVSAP